MKWVQSSHRAIAALLFLISLILFTIVNWPASGPYELIRTDPPTGPYHPFWEATITDGHVLLFNDISGKAPLDPLIYRVLRICIPFPIPDEWWMLRVPCVGPVTFVDRAGRQWQTAWLGWRNIVDLGPLFGYIRLAIGEARSMA